MECNRSTQGGNHLSTSLEKLSLLVRVKQLPTRCVYNYSSPSVQFPAGLSNRGNRFRRITKRILGTGAVVLAAARGHSDPVRQLEGTTPAPNDGDLVSINNLAIAAAQKATVELEKILFLEEEPSTVAKSPTPQPTLPESPKPPLLKKKSSSVKQDPAISEEKKVVPKRPAKLQGGEYLLAPWLPQGFFVRLWPLFKPTKKAVEIQSGGSAKISDRHFVNEYLNTMNSVARKLIRHSRERDPGIAPSFSLIKEAFKFLKGLSKVKTEKALRYGAVLDILLLLVQYDHLTPEIQKWFKDIEEDKLSMVTMTNKSWNSGKALEDLFGSFKKMSWNLLKKKPFNDVQDWTPEKLAPGQNLNTKPKNEKRVQLNTEDGTIIEKWLKETYDLCLDTTNLKPSVMHQEFHDGYARPHMAEIVRSLSLRTISSRTISSRTISSRTASPRNAKSSKPASLKGSNPGSSGSLNPGSSGSLNPGSPRPLSTTQSSTGRSTPEILIDTPESIQKHRELALASIFLFHKKLDEKFGEMTFTNLSDLLNFCIEKGKLKP